MNVFLSYASEHREVAEQTKFALTGSGHKVFFDRDSLPVGDDYHRLIRKAVDDSDLFVFLISPESVTQGCYALTELKYAREKWPDPKGKVLPVMIGRTEYSHIPAYLKAISILQPEGNAAAEIAAEIQKWRGRGIQDVVKLGGHTLKSIGASFIAVLSGPRKFIKSVDHSAESALIDASIFVVFISVVNLTITLPAYRLAHVSADSITYVLIDTVMTIAFWFLYGSIYHLCARFVGGHATYHSSLVALLYLKAFTVISGIFALPLSLQAVSWSLESSDVPSVSQWQVLGDQLLQSPTALLCVMLSSAIALYGWICTVGVVTIIHEVGRATGVLIALLGAGLSWVVFFIVEKPVIGLFWRAFSS